MNFMKKTLAASLISITALAGMMHAQEAQAKEELVFSTSMYSTHVSFKNVYFPLFDKVTEMSNGEVTYTYFEPGTLVPDKENFQATEDGILDVGLLFTSSIASSFPVTSVLDYPLLFSSGAHGSLVGARMVEENPAIAEEFKNVKFLFSSFSVPNDLLTTVPIKTLEDLKGKRIGVRTFATAEVMKLLGAVPVQIPMTDMYVSLERGMLDGVLLPSPQYKASKVIEAAKHLTRCGIVSASCFFVMNKDRYESLPKGAKDAIDMMSGRPASSLDSAWIDDTQKLDIQSMIDDYGVTMYELSPAEKARWAEKVAPMYDSWKAEMKEDGVDGDAVLKQLHSFVDYYTPAKIKEERAVSEKIFPGMFPKIN